MQLSPYKGRFAPSPSGPLHFGSLIAALGSFLQARQQSGKWLVRIEDIDQPRAVKGADKIILKQLEDLGLFWDDEVVYQSQRLDLYQSALDKLDSNNLIYPCSCSRKEITDQIYPGTCRYGIEKICDCYSYRIKVENEVVGFNDRLQGYYSQSLSKELGDFVVKRRDNIFAYHLVVVVDDGEQNITDIVRGNDLIDSTPGQIYLQNLLGLKQPDYLHLPVAITRDGKKISKQNNARSIETDKHAALLFHALEFLGQNPPKEIIDGDKESILDWAIKNWSADNLPKVKEIIVENY